MEKSRLEIKVGLFIFIGLALLAVILIQFSKSASLWRGTYNLHLHAANVGGIKPRAAVLLAGVQIGSVDQIDLATNSKSVMITLKIYRDFQIFHDAQFAIEQAGFLGDQFISIIPTTNTPPYLADGDDVSCQSPFNLQQVARDAAGFIQRIDETAKKLDASVTDLRAQVLNAQTLASFGTSITNARHGERHQRHRQHQRRASRPRGQQRGGVLQRPPRIASGSPRAARHEQCEH